MTGGGHGRCRTYQKVLAHATIGCMTTDVRASRVQRPPTSPHRVPLRGGRARARRRGPEAPRAATVQERLRDLRAAYDQDSQRITTALPKVFDTVAGLPAARAGMAELDAAIEAAVRTVMTALKLVRADRPVGPRRVAKAALRQRRQDEKFWTKRLMRLVDLRTRASWIALDTPGLIGPTTLTGALNAEQEVSNYREETGHEEA